MESVIWWEYADNTNMAPSLRMSFRDGLGLLPSRNNKQKPGLLGI